MSEKRIVTQEDLDLNPSLVEQGVKVGEEIELGLSCDETGVALTGEAEPASKEEKEEGNSTDIVGGREKDDR